MPQVTLRLVTIENYHEVIPKYITENKIIISEYDDMTKCILRMIREGHCFNMDKNLLRGFLEDLTYMFSPNDDKNKDRIVNMLGESDDDSDDSDDNDGNMENMMMNMLMQGMQNTGKEKKVEEKVEEEIVEEEKIEEVKDDEKKVEEVKDEEKVEESN